MEEKTQKIAAVSILEEMAQKSGSGVSVDELKEMAENGVLYGHKKTKTQPRFKQFVFATRNGMEIIDLVKTNELLNKAAEFLKKALQDKKIVLVVGTQPASWGAIEQFAEKFNLPTIKNKWIGGLVTNFKVIGQRLEYFRKMRDSKERGDFSKYTKKEQVVISRNLDKMAVMFDGLDKLDKIPDVLFVVDASIKGHMTAIREARIAGIPIVAIIDSDDNPDFITYPIPANDHAKISIEWLISKIAQKMFIE